MQIHCIGSGSAGNCYALKYDDEILLLDLGMRFTEIKQGINYEIANIVGCVITHCHSDHSLSVKDFKKIGIPIWQPYITHERIMKFGSFTVQSFSVPHDDTECYGFFIKVDGQKIVYATDYEYIPVTFKKQEVNHFIIECNYQKERVSNNANNRNHVLKGHAELQTVLDVLKENQTESLQTVLICHLSDGNANEKEMVKTIKETVGNGVTVDYARKGLTIELRRKT